MQQLVVSALPFPHNVHTKVQAERAIARVRFKFSALTPLLDQPYTLFTLDAQGAPSGARWGAFDPAWLDPDNAARFLTGDRRLPPAGMLCLASFGREEWLWAVAVEGERRLWLRLRHTLALRADNPEGFAVLLSQVERAAAQWKAGARAVGFDRFRGEFDAASALVL